MNKKQINKLAPIHPGEILREEILMPKGISPTQLAESIKVPKEMIEWICEEKMGITSDLATRLALYFKTSVGLWINLQTTYEKKMMSINTESIIKKLKPVIIPYVDQV